MSRVASLTKRLKYAWYLAKQKEMDNLGSSPVFHGGLGIEISKEHSAQPQTFVKICVNCRVLYSLLTYESPEGERRCACLFGNLEAVGGTAQLVVNPYFGEKLNETEVSGNFKLPAETIEPFDVFDENLEGAVGGGAADETKKEDDVFTPNEVVDIEVINCTMNVKICVRCADVSDKCLPFFLGKTLGFVCRHFSPVDREAQFNGEDIFCYFGSGKDFSSQIMSLEAQIHDAYKENAVIHSNWNSSSEEVQFLRGEVRKKEGEMRNLVMEFNNLKAEKVGACNDLAAIRAEFVKVNDKCKQLKANFDVVIKQQCANKELEIHQLKAQLSKNSIDLQNLRLEANKMRLEVQQSNWQLEQQQRSWAVKEKEFNDRIVAYRGEDDRVRDVLGKLNKWESEIQRLKGDLQLDRYPLNNHNSTVQQEEVSAQGAALFGRHTPSQPVTTVIENSPPVNLIGKNGNGQAAASIGQLPACATRKSSYHLYRNLKPFSGSADYTFEEFVANFENARLVGNWVEDEVCPLFKGVLNGEPFKKMLRIEKREGASLKFDAVKEEFLRLYGDPATKTTFFEKFCALKCKDSESVRNFSQRAEEYFSKAFPENGGDQDMLKSRFIKGLPERIADKVEDRNPKSFKEALTAAIEIEQRFEEKEKQVFEVAAIKSTPKEKVELSPQVIRLLNVWVDNSTQQSAPTAGYSMGKSTKPFVPIENRECYNCKGVGHLFKDCTLEKGQLNDNDHSE